MYRPLNKRGKSYGCKVGGYEVNSQVGDAGVAGSLQLLS